MPYTQNTSGTTLDGVLEALSDIAGIGPGGGGTVGGITDAAVTDPTASATLVSLLKGILTNAAAHKSIKTVSGSLTADTDVIAAVTSKRIKVIAYSLTTTGQNTAAAVFKSNGTGGTELWRVLLSAPTGGAFNESLAVSAPSFLFATAAGQKLTLDVANTDPISYSISYFDDDAA